MKFAHLGDCHLGSWAQQELRELNIKSFQEAISRCLKEKVEFILISGDLFDSAYPPIETLKQAFEEFRKIKEAGIPVFLIAGSHDYSVSGNTFLDVLEKAGFCRNVFVSQEKDGKIILEPTLYKNVAIYGYPGRKSGLEVDDIERIQLQDSPGLFKILMLHTTIRDAIGTAPIKAVDERRLPQVNYVALAHLHINYHRANRIYCGPTFPNNISEIEELKHGSFYIFDNGQIKRQEIKLKEVVAVRVNISDALTAGEQILSQLKEHTLNDKIVILRLHGNLERGSISSIDFTKIDSYVDEQKAFVFLKSTTNLRASDSELHYDFSPTEDPDASAINEFSEKNDSPFNTHIVSLMRALSIAKLEDETNSTFENRLLAESRKILFP